MTKHEERAANLAAFVNTTQETLAEIERRIDGERREARTWAEERIAAARRDDARQRSELEVFFAGRAVATINPLVKTFTETDASKSTAKAIADAWRELSSHCLDELGADLDFRFLGFAFADAVGLGDRLAHYDAWKFGVAGCQHAHRTNAAVEAIMKGDPISVIEARLREAELAVADDASKHIYSYPERHAAMRSRATRTSIEVALDEVEVEKKQRAHEAAVKAGPQGAYRIGTSNGGRPQFPIEPSEDASSEELT